MNVALRPNLNLISLCTGGGGLDLGVELAIPSARSVVLVEREAFACAHLVSAMQQGLMAEAALWSDVTTFNGRQWRGLVDGLIGGIPCQPHSLAGKRLGEDDERDLWSDARRIIVQSGAWFVLIENVRGMLSSGGAERVWRDLHRLGFEVEGGLFTAAEVGASHERERIFVLAVADARCDGRPAWRAGRQHEHRTPICEQFGGNGKAMADAGCQRSEVGVSGSIGPDEGRNAGELINSCGALVHAERSERREDSRGGYRPNRDHGGWDQAAGWLGEPSPSLGYTSGERGWGLSVQPGRHDQAGSYVVGTSLFPPGPSDLRSWESILASSPELEPAFRRVADGLASRLDTARVDRLRMLGNGVVSLEAAYAVRTLATRLAGRGSASANRLVRLMVAA